MIPTDTKQPLKQAQAGPAPVVRIWALAGEVGLLIVIPLLVLLLLGIRVDRAADTTPLFIIIGLLVAFTISTIAVARKIRRVQELSQ